MLAAGLVREVTRRESFRAFSLRIQTATRLHIRRASGLHGSDVLDGPKAAMPAVCRLSPRHPWSSGGAQSFGTAGREGRKMTPRSPSEMLASGYTAPARFSASRNWARNARRRV